MSHGQGGHNYYQQPAQPRRTSVSSEEEDHSDGERPPRRTARRESNEFTFQGAGLRRTVNTRRQGPPRVNRSRDQNPRTLAMEASRAVRAYAEEPTVPAPSVIEEDQYYVRQLALNDQEMRFFGRSGRHNLNERRNPAGRGQERRSSVPPPTRRPPRPHLGIPRRNQTDPAFLPEEYRQRNEQRSYFSPDSSNRSSQVSPQRQIAQVSRFSWSTQPSQPATNRSYIDNRPPVASYTSTPATDTAGYANRYTYGAPRAWGQGQLPFHPPDRRRNSASSDECDPHPRVLRERRTRDGHYHSGGSGEPF